MQSFVKTGLAAPASISGKPLSLQKFAQAFSSPFMRHSLLACQAPSRAFAKRSKLDRQRSRSPGRSPREDQIHAPRSPFNKAQQRFFLSEEPAQRAQAPGSASPFAHDSTFTLMKKLLIYRMMGSNLFINYSLMGIQAAYRVFGTRLTNYTIESTAASVFTGGVTTSNLIQYSEALEQRGVGTIGCYVVEGLRGAAETHLDQFMDFTVESIRELTEEGREGNLALKLTAYIDTELMEKVSLAQDRFLREVLQVRFDAADESVLSREQLAANLAAIGINNYSR